MPDFNPALNTRGALDGYPGAVDCPGFVVSGRRHGCRDLLRVDCGQREGGGWRTRGRNQVLRNGQGPNRDRVIRRRTPRRARPALRPTALPAAVGVVQNFFLDKLIPSWYSIVL